VGSLTRRSATPTAHLPTTTPTGADHPTAPPVGGPRR
jgi:hypothetical protein